MSEPIRGVCRTEDRHLLPGGAVWEPSDNHVQAWELPVDQRPALQYPTGLIFCAKIPAIPGERNAERVASDGRGYVCYDVDALGHPCMHVVDCFMTADDYLNEIDELLMAARKYERIHKSIYKEP